MRRFYVEKIHVNQKTCVITGSEAKHITKVLRMKPGDPLILMDEKGSRFRSAIESVSFQEVHVRLEESLPEPPPSPVKITLCQAIAKSQAMDFLIQKTSELGVAAIAPFSSKRTVVRFDKRRIDNKMGHWRQIAINSAKQCGRAIPMKIEMPSSFSELMQRLAQEDALKVVFWEEESLQNLKEVLKTSSSAVNFVGMIGPEGGFDSEEIETARDAGFVSVSLGERILRAETAAITMAAIVQYELGDLGLGPWKK